MNNFIIQVQYVREGTPQVFTGTFLAYSGGDALVRARAFVRTYLKPESVNGAVIMRTVEV